MKNSSTSNTFEALTLKTDLGKVKMELAISSNLLLEIVYEMHCIENALAAMKIKVQ